MRNISVQIQNYGGRSLGYYHRIFDHIKINSKFWVTADYYDKKLVLFHELAHGILRRKHQNNTYYADGCPESMMKWNFKKACYIRYYDYYNNELFEKSGEFKP